MNTMNLLKECKSLSFHSVPHSRLFLAPWFVSCSKSLPKLCQCIGIGSFGGLCVVTVRSPAMYAKFAHQKWLLTWSFGIFSDWMRSCSPRYVPHPYVQPEWTDNSSIQMHWRITIIPGHIPQCASTKSCIPFYKQSNNDIEFGPIQNRRSTFKHDNLVTIQWK